MKKSFVLFLYILSYLSAYSQDRVIRFTMEDVIRLAQEQSPDALLARNRFKASYWQFRSYKANYLPGIRLSTTLPNFVRSIDWNESLQDFQERNSLTNYGQLSLTQNIGLTGGTVSVSSNLQQINQLGSDGKTSYISSPVSFSFSQPLFGYNSMKWERKIQPIVFEEAKRTYIEAMEQLSAKALGRFFDLASAQLNLRISQINYNNSDTLYKIAQGRYNIGTIAQNDLLQMQLSFLNAKTSLTSAEIELENQKARLRSLLGYNEKMEFELILPVSIPSVSLNFDKILELAKVNNPDAVAWQRRLIESQRDVAQAKGQRNSIDLYASYGFDHSKESQLPAVYQSPYNDKQQIRVGMSIPLVDWGKNKGKVKVAQSNQQLTEVQVKQEQIDFEQSIYLQVMQFNLQNDQVMIAAKSDTIAQYRYDVTKQRFLIGKIDVLNLNDALKEKDSAKRGYISALRQYWNYYYILRQLTLYDIVTEKPLSADFEQIIE